MMLAIYKASVSISSICHCICFKRTCIICRQQIDKVEFEPQYARNVLITDIAVVMFFKYRSQRLLPADYTLGVQHDMVDFA